MQVAPDHGCRKFPSRPSMVHRIEGVAHSGTGLWDAEGRQQGVDEYWHRARELIEAESHFIRGRSPRGHRT